jgi:uncharacterized membrane-anchored protein
MGSNRVENGCNGVSGAALKKTAFLLGVTLMLSAGSALAETSAQFFKSYQDYSDAGKEFLDKIEPKTGAIDLADGVHLELKDKFYFLDHDDAVQVLTEGWGNPANTTVETLGMIFPVDYDPLADGTWGIELRHEKIGYVDDLDAATIDYSDLLRTMQSDTNSRNEERVKEGFSPVTLVGWASPPTYDTVNKRLHWAKELQFGEATSRTLNYDVRFLGREGVFVMSYIATMDQLPEIKQSLDEVLNLASFAEGKRYADYLPGVDTAATIGIGGLIAGKAAIKTGLLAVALVALKKFGFLLLLPVIWLWRFVRSKFSRSGT